MEYNRKPSHIQPLHANYAWRVCVAAVICVGLVNTVCLGLRVICTCNNLPMHHLQHTSCGFGVLHLDDGGGVVQHVA